MCLSNIEVIGQYVVEIQLLSVSENKGVPKFKSKSRDLAISSIRLNLHIFG